MRFRESSVAFLSPEAEAFEDQLVTRHQPFFDLFARVTRLAYDALDRLDSGRTDNLELYVAAAFARLCESSQAVAYLAARGFSHEAAAELRIALEVLLKLNAALEKPDFARAVIDADLFELRKLTALTLSGSAGELSDEARAAVDLRKQEIEDAIAERKARKVTIEEIAREVGALRMYNTVYRLTCSSVHVSPRSLSDYVRLHPETGVPEEVVHGPRDDNAELHLHAASEFLLIAVSLLDRHRSLALPPAFADVSAAFLALKPK